MLIHNSLLHFLQIMSDVALLVFVGLLWTIFAMVSRDVLGNGEQWNLFLAVIANDELF